jgi:4-hydroxybenzoyl-CoA reductase subunit alpha
MFAAAADRYIESGIFAFEFANAKLGFNIIYDLDIRQGWVYNVARPERGMSYYDLCKEALRGKEGQRIIGRGFYTPAEKA